MRAWVVAALCCTGCDLPGDHSLAKTVALGDLVGTWSWQLSSGDEHGTRAEQEAWMLWPGPTPTVLGGVYVRRVEVSATDGRPFVCNQRSSYVQRARFDIEARLVGDRIEITETGYAAEPSPCDHGFRQVGAYTAQLADGALTLRWSDGEQTLDRVSREVPGEPLALPWARPPALAGSWTWTSTSFDAAGHVQDETEHWQITARGADAFDATYRRRVVVRSATGATIACANAPRWSYEDTYVLDARREEEHWHFHERAVDAGTHACLVTTPTRTLDEATAEQIGEHLVMEWRGKRRQVLTRAL